ncbi:MAG TPA: VOC family protein [Microlunatus sp.]
MAQLRDLVFDATAPYRTAQFWAAALDGYQIAPYDEDELERLRASGVARVEDDPHVLVTGGAGAPRLWFQRVPEPKTVKNRLHPDVFADDLTAEAERLSELGARLLQVFDDHALMADPEGNEFCLYPNG